MAQSTSTASALPRNDQADVHLDPSVSRFATLGSLIYIGMGLCHGLVTLIDAVRPTFLGPANPVLLEQLAITPVALAPSMMMWSAYLGFNWSHSLGLLTFGSLYLLIVRRAPELLKRIPAFLLLALVVAAIFCLIGGVYWFYAPATVSAIGGACYLRAYLGLRRHRG